MPPASPWPIFATNEPTDPEEAVTVRDTLGIQFARHMMDGFIYEDLGVQMRVRAGTHAAARAKAIDIADACDMTVYRQHVTVDNVGYCVHTVQRTVQTLLLGHAQPIS